MKPLFLCFNLAEAMEFHCSCRSALMLCSMAWGSAMQCSGGIHTTRGKEMKLPHSRAVTSCCIVSSLTARGAQQKLLPLSHSFGKAQIVSSCSCRHCGNVCIKNGSYLTRIHELTYLYFPRIIFFLFPFSPNVSMAKRGFIALALITAFDRIELDPVQLG